MSGKLERAFREIERKRREDFLHQMEQRGLHAENLTFSAAENLKQRGEIADWQRDDDLDHNKVDLVITDNNQWQYLLQIKSSQHALEMAQQKDREGLLNTVCILIVAPNLPVEEVEKMILTKVAEVRAQYINRGNAGHS